MAKSKIVQLDRSMHDEAPDRLWFNVDLAAVLAIETEKLGSQQDGDKKERNIAVTLLLPNHTITLRRMEAVEADELLRKWTEAREG